MTQLVTTVFAQVGYLFWLKFLTSVLIIKTHSLYGVAKPKLAELCRQLHLKSCSIEKPSFFIGDPVWSVFIRNSVSRSRTTLE